MNWFESNFKIARQHFFSVGDRVTYEGRSATVIKADQRVAGSGDGDLGLLVTIEYDNDTRRAVVMEHKCVANDDGLTPHRAIPATPLHTPAVNNFDNRNVCSIDGGHTSDRCNGYHINVLALCEQGKLLLVPGKFYRFEVVPDCTKCAEIADCL